MRPNGTKPKKKIDATRSVDRFMNKLLKDMRDADLPTRTRFAPVLVKWLAVKLGVDDPEHGTGFLEETE